MPSFRRGSWGTPEFGLSERVSNFFGQGRTSQGGSNLYGNQKQTTLVPGGTRGGQPFFVRSGSSGAYGVQAPYRTGGGQVLGSSNRRGGGYTGADALQLGLDINQLRREGRFMEDGPEDILDQGYNEYFAQLDQMFEGLGGQRSALESGVNAQRSAGIEGLRSQRAQGQRDIAGYRTKATAQQEKSLRGLAEDMANQFQAGNVFLGTRGAADSSAAGQYSYALNKLGTKQRADITGRTSEVMGDLDAREQRLTDIFNTETNRLNAESDAQIADIANWFYTQQNNLRGMRAAGAKERSQQLLQLAMQDIANINAERQSRNSALEQWAYNTAQNIGQLRQNMHAVSTYQVPYITNTRLAGTPQVDSRGNFIVPPGYGYRAGAQEPEQ